MKKLTITKVRKRVFIIGLTLLVIAIGIFLGIIYKTTENRLLNSTSNLLDERSISLESAIKRNVDFVLEMKTLSGIYLRDDLSGDEIEYYLNEVKNKAVYNEEKEYYSLPEGTRINSHNIKTTYAFDKDKLNKPEELALEVRMLNNLAEFQIAGSEHVTSIVLSYYLTYGAFITSVYPPIPLDEILIEFTYTRDFFDYAYEVYNEFAPPEVNENGDYFWTEPYLDRAGNGMMVTCAIPVYIQEEYTGVLGCDVALTFIKEYTKEFEELESEFIVSTITGNVISSSTLEYEKETDIVLLNDELESISSSDNLIIFNKALVNAPWIFSVAVSKHDLRNNVINEIIVYIIVSVLILVGSLIIYIYVNNKFIIPGLELEEELRDLNRDLDSLVVDRTNELLATTKSLEDTNKRLMNLLNSSTQVAVIVSDIKEKITLFNIGAENMLGYAASDVIGTKSLLDFYDSEEVLVRSKQYGVNSENKNMDLLQLIINNEEKCDEWTFIKKDNKKIHVLLSGNIIFDSNGDPFEVICIAVDITKRKMIQEELKVINLQLETRVFERTVELENIKDELEIKLEELTNAQEMIIESEKLAALGTLVSGVAHEINTPLGVCITANTHITQNLNRYKEKFESKTLTKTDLELFFEMISSASDMVYDNLLKVDELIRKFKLISSSQNHYVLSEFNFSEYLNRLSEVLHSLFSDTNHKLLIESEVEMINSYEGVFLQILTNLVSNSVKHGFKNTVNGEMKITVTSNSKEYKMIYTDNGCGINEEAKSKIFEPFYTTNRSEGTGLGMIVIHNIVKQKLNGSIIVLDNDLEGVKIVITWPKL